MEKREQLYEGKAKKVFATDDPSLVIVDYKDDATAFNGAKNAAVLAAQILAVSDDDLAAKLDQARADMANQIAEKEAKLQAELG